MTLIRHILLGGLLTLFAACKPGKPSDVLSAGEMEDVLYDYHLAGGLAKTKPTDSIAYYERLYRHAVFRKHELTQADFDRSMAWYSRRTEELKNVYEAIAKRLGEEETSGRNTAIPLPGEATASGDTLNSWHGATSALLCSQNTNRFTFVETPDTTFRADDRIEWRFSTKWYYNEGTRQAVAALFIHYEGDSVATVRQNVFFGKEQTVSATLADRPVKRIEGLVYLRSGWSERPRMVYLSHFALLRIHPKRVVYETTSAPPNDSLTVRSRNEENATPSSPVRSAVVEKPLHDEPSRRHHQLIRK